MAATFGRWRRRQAFHSDSEIEQRIAFAESITVGKTIFQWSPRNDAAREIKNLTRELLNHGKEELHNRTPAQAAHG